MMIDDSVCFTVMLLLRRLSAFQQPLIRAIPQAGVQNMRDGSENRSELVAFCQTHLIRLYYVINRERTCIQEQRGIS